MSCGRRFGDGAQIPQDVMPDVARRSVLFLTHEPPLPAVSGTRVRSSQLMRQLAQRGWRVRLFSLAPSAAPPADLEALHELVTEPVVEAFEPHPVARYARLAALVATGQAFQQGMFWAPGPARRLEAMLQEERFDAIVTGQLYMHPYVPPAFRSVEVLDCHNVELRRMETMAQALGWRPRGLVARVQRRTVSRYEQRAVAEVAHVLAVSDVERRYFEAVAPARVTLVPNGVDCGDLPPRAEVPPEPTLLFVGSLDYSANTDGVHHLLADVVPRVAHRDARITIVGGGPPPAIVQAAARSALEVEVTGRVPDTGPYFERSRMLVVPLRFGGGTRLKILEAFARGVPVVTTSIGCEGINVVHGRDAIVADDPATLARWIDRLLNDEPLCRSLAENGRRLAERAYDWEIVGESLEAALRPLTGSYI